MITLHSLHKNTKNKKRRVGRGHGSGRGKTAGRGTKGQKARESIRLDFEGGQLPLLKRLPLYRGKGKNKPVQGKTLVVNVKLLNLLPKGTRVTKETLVKYHILVKDSIKFNRVKILGDGELTVPLEVELPTSKSARKKIEQAGGKVIYEDRHIPA
ncbi:50S ribosomal protein L15 [Candidatus Gottesmanbacteria bacterium]|nr:50S ribosomal protein L15 [Candidatus Gottesmanbacteria bacterium]